jgi:DNA-binding response OmpR family regulator
LKTDKPDLLILDIMMESDLQGYKMLGELRDQEVFNNLPIIIYSGMAEVLGVNFRSVVEDVELYPNVAFVDKADDIDELVFRMNNLLEV